MSRSQLIQDINTAILNFDGAKVTRLVELALKNKIDPQDIMQWSFMPACRRISEKFRGADFYIPDVIVSLSPIMAGFKVLNESMDTKAHHKGKILIGTVAGDMHDIGKSIVIAFLHSNGYYIIDLGVDVTAQQFVEAVREHKPAVLALSALLTTTMGEMATVIDTLDEHRLRRGVKIIVGGGPVTEEFARHIGADGFAATAPDVVDVVLELLNKKE